MRGNEACPRACADPRVVRWHERSDLATLRQHAVPPTQSSLKTESTWACLNGGNRKRRTRPRTGKRVPNKAEAWGHLSRQHAALAKPSMSDAPSTAGVPADSNGGGGAARADEELASTSGPPPAEQAEQAQAAPQPGFVSRLASAVQKGRSLGWLPMP